MIEIRVRQFAVIIIGLFGLPCLAFNVAVNGTAAGNNAWPGYEAYKAIDNDEATMFHTLNDGTGWWQLELDSSYDLESIVFLVQGQFPERALGSTVSVYEADGTTQIGSTHTVTTLHYMHQIDNAGAGYSNAKFIRFAQPLPRYLVLTEVRAYTHNEQVSELEFKTIDPDAVAYGQSYNQTIVYNDYGIFMTYLKSRNSDYTSQDWRLIRSTDGGRTFTTVYQEVVGTNAPVIETDEDGTIYLVRHNYPTSEAWLYIFSPHDNYATHTTHFIPEGGGGAKFSMYYDTSRQCLYYFGANANKFYVIDRDGTVLRNRTLTRAGASAYAHYPSLDMDENGILYAAWTTTPVSGIYLYWSIHAARSIDGGNNWQNLKGLPVTVPIVADETGPTECIILNDEFDYQTWLWNFAAKDGKLHFAYLAQTPSRRMHYVRYDQASGQEDHRLYPEFKGSTISLAGVDGFVATVPEEEGCLFFTSVTGENLIASLYSEDNGQTWHDHAINFKVGNYYGKQGCRHTLNGSVIGAAFDQETDEVIFYKAPPVSPRNELIRYIYNGNTLHAEFTGSFGRPRQIRFRLSAGTFTDWYPYEESFTAAVPHTPRTYQLKTRFEAFSEEMDLQNNRCNLDAVGPVNWADFFILADAWQSESGGNNWNPACDLFSPKDNLIDEKDLSVFTNNWLMP